jgi:hypothetical protein
MPHEPPPLPPGAGPPPEPPALPPVRVAPAVPAAPPPVARQAVDNPLLRNPFAVLGASTRDNRWRITELAEEKSLELDHELCQKARADLTHPRNRLAAEIAWMPGVSPARAQQLLEKCRGEPGSIRFERGVPPLAHANLMVAAFLGVDERFPPELLSGFVLQLAQCVEELSVDTTLRDVNEDRAVAGFPAVSDAEAVAAELDERKRAFRDGVRDTLNRMPAATLVAVMTRVVETATGRGERHAPMLVEGLIDHYEVQLSGYLQRDTEKLLRLADAVRAAAPDGEAAVIPALDRLEAAARAWDRLAQPIQLAAKARGNEHRPSHDVALAIRLLGVELFNDHDLLAQSRRVTTLLQELFPELPEFSERLDQDVAALGQIDLRRQQAQERRTQWEKDITYRIELGLIFKDALEISPQGLSWKNRRYPLDKVTRVRWGGTAHYVNGIHTGNTYTIAFGDAASETDVVLAKEEQYSAFVDRLWRAVCVRLLTEMLESLKAGKEIVFKDLTIRDGGVAILIRKLFGANRRIELGWDKVRIWSQKGAFFVGADGKPEDSVGLSYIEVPNVHVLEQAIRMAFKRAGMQRLSDVLDD